MSKKVENPISRRQFLKNTGLLGLACATAPSLMNFKSAAAFSPLRADGPEVCRCQANWIPQIQYFGFMAAAYKGFYKMEDIDGSLLAGGPGIVSMRVLDSKQSEFSLVGSGDAFVNSFVEGMKSVNIATEFQRSPAGLISLKDNPILTPQDAIGKRIGLQEGSTQAWMVVCAKNGIKDSDYELVYVSTDPTVLVDGTVDGYWGYMTSQPGTLRLAGYECEFLDPFKWGNPSLGNFILCRKDYLREKRDVVVKWLRATIRGHVYAMNHIEEMLDYVMDTYGKDLGLNREQQYNEAMDQLKFLESDLTKEKGLMWFDKSTWQETINTQVEFGELDEADAPKPDDLSTYEVLEEVYKDGIDAVYAPALEM